MISLDKLAFLLLSVCANEFSIIFHIHVLCGQESQWLIQIFTAPAHIQLKEKKSLVFLQLTSFVHFWKMFLLEFIALINKTRLLVI